jgi:hypothetical protein
MTKLTKYSPIQLLQFLIPQWLGLQSKFLRYSYLKLHWHQLPKVCLNWTQNSRNLTLYLDARRAASSYSTSDGPFMHAATFSWSQYITPVIVGTVMVTVNEAADETSSTTIYHTDYEEGGSLALLTRTDTDTAGTVTHVVTDANGTPTALWVFDSPISNSKLTS